MTYKCYSCNDGAIFYENKCYKDCPEGTVAADSKCVECGIGCKTCKSSDIEQCITCKDRFSFYESRCYLNCPSGTVKGEKEDVSRCIECKGGCSSCLAADLEHCETCKEGLSI